MGLGVFSTGCGLDSILEEGWFVVERSVTGWGSWFPTSRQEKGDRMGHGGKGG